MKIEKRGETTDILSGGDVVGPSYLRMDGWMDIRMTNQKNTTVKETKRKYMKVSLKEMRRWWRVLIISEIKVKVLYRSRSS